MTTRAYYNEHDPHAAEWLRNLIAEGLIAPGDVDERSIEDVVPADLVGYAQCHFFAGIGGWSLALRLAGVPDDWPVWTGSCPCQPFSAAGKGKGTADERHLWPAFLWLVRQCRPVCVFGEQVTGAIGHGWLDGVQADMEAEGYAVGASVLGAHSVGAPHIRQRLYWGAVRVANSDCQRRNREPIRILGRGPREAGAEASGSGGNSGVADGVLSGLSPVCQEQAGAGSGGGARNPWADSVWWLCRDGKWRRVPGRVGDTARDYERGDSLSGAHGQGGADRGPGGAGGMEHAKEQIPSRKPFGGLCRGLSNGPREPSAGGGLSDAERVEREGGVSFDGEGDGAQGEWPTKQPARHGFPVPAAGHEWLEAEPGLFPLAARVSGRVAVVRPAQCGEAEDEEEREVNAAVALKGAGNAIVPQLAAVFVEEFEGAVADFLPPPSL